MVAGGAGLQAVASGSRRRVLFALGGRAACILSLSLGLKG